MNYKKILVLSLFVCLVSCFYGCTKRDKLTDNTMILQIEPAGNVFCNLGTPCTLKSVIKNIKMEEVDQPVRWSVSPAELGKFDSATARTVNFLAEKKGSGTISLSCQGVVTTVNVSVS